MRGIRALAGVAALALCGAAGTANALVIQFDSVITGYTPATGGAPWLTATVLDTTDGVNITFSTTLANPEFITDVYFALTSGVSCSSGRSPAGTGPYELCYLFDPNAQWAGPSFTQFFAGYSESNFDIGTSGWIAAAHIQGIQPDCSGWIGAYGGGTVNNGSGSCGSTSVPEPATLGLFGLGLLGLGLGFGRRRKT